jgi:DNA-directed RNA polymerase subunit N (RpoN/RPB10)
MCSAVRCRTCGKTTWSGCGSHVAQVRDGIPDDQWCAGHLDDSGTQAPWARRLLETTGESR